MTLHRRLTRPSPRARHELGRRWSEPSGSWVAELIHATVSPLQDRVAARALNVETHIPASLELHTDPVLLRAIIANLLDNAVEYSPPRSTIGIRGETSPGSFVLRITNRVEHLTESDLPRLFERFWRNDAARSGTTHAGLGLSLSRAFAIRLSYALTASLDAIQGLTMTLSGPDRPALAQAKSVGPDAELLPVHPPSGS